LYSVLFRPILQLFCLIVSETETHEPHNIIDIEGSFELHQDTDTIEQLREDEPELSQIQQQRQQLKETVTTLQQKRTKCRSIFRNRKLLLLLALLLLVLLLLAILLPIMKYYFDDHDSENSGVNSLDVQ